MTVAHERAFSWDVLVDRYWDRRPVLFTEVDPAPFHDDEVFRAAVACAHGARADGTTFAVGRHRLTDAGPLLPQPQDAGFDDYEQRLATRLGGDRYALVSHYLHTTHRPQWERERAFYGGLWERVGLPVSGAITALFHGTYEHSPAGVHKDRFSTFMFVLRGVKRMRFWPTRPWPEAVSTKLDYADHLDGSFAVDVGPGDLLYWPSSHYHVGESLGRDPATSVNVGVPRAEHRSAFELAGLFDRLGTGPADDHPPSLAGVTDRLTELVRGGAVTELARQLRASDGFLPAPPA